MTELDDVAVLCDRRVPWLFRQTPEDSGKRSSLTIAQLQGHVGGLELRCWSGQAGPNNTQIYGETNQIQRMMIARQVLK